MNIVMPALFLLVAACLEVGGDAVVRMGIKGHGSLQQLVYVLLGGAILLAYGFFVNLAPMDFGKTLGIYVVIFFCIAQIANACIYGIRPGAPILAGGALILAGGIIMTVWKV